MDKLAIFYHVYVCNDKWQLWTDEQIGAIKKSGILNENVTININVNIKNSLKSYVPDMLMMYGDMANINISDNNNYEANTLKCVYEYAQQNPEHKILYIHTKGISRKVKSTDQFPDIGRHDWRQMMNYFCINRYVDCIKMLNTYDAVGCRHAIKPVPHFSGNFWWANCKYIKTLQLPDDPNRFKFKWKRLSCEFWIGNNTYTSDGKIVTGPSNLKSLHQPKVSRMTNGYDKKHYIK